MTRRRIVAVVFLVVGLLAGRPASAQVGAGLLDLNGVPEATLATLPNMTPAIAKAFASARPFDTVVAANAFLLGQKLTQEQINALYERAFIHINLNTGTAEEILLVPRIARRMTREFEEYRPWVNFAQFDREIGKYVDDAEVQRLKQYVFIPIDLNTGTDEQFLTIPQVGNSMLREFKEYRPWASRAQFEREIGKYVDAKEVARLWRFVTIR